jgi:hypothetical protein
MSVRRIKEVVQSSSKTTSVTANGYDGIITTVALTDAADTSFNFTVNNDKVQETSTIMLTPIYAGTTGDVKAVLVSQTKGSFVVKVSNVGVAVLNAVAKIQFKVTHN